MTQVKNYWLPYFFSVVPLIPMPWPLWTRRQQPRTGYRPYISWRMGNGEWIAPDDLENMPLNENANDDTKNE